MGGGDLGNQPAAERGTALSGAAVSVTRPHVLALGVGPRPRLRPALEDALCTVEARLGAFARVAGDQQIDFVWERRSPLTVLRETREGSWNVSPTVIVQLEGHIATPAATALERETQSRTVSPPLVPMQLAIVERRLETRVVARVREELVEATRRPPEIGTPETTLAAPRKIAPARTPRRAPSLDPPPAAEMTLARAPSISAPAGPVPHPAIHTTVAAPARSAAAAVLPAAPLPIDRITTEVVRALDARVIAWRERMGRS